MGPGETGCVVYRDTSTTFFELDLKFGCDVLTEVLVRALTYEIIVSVPFRRLRSVG